MKIFQFITPDGSVECKVDLLSADLNINATIMDIQYTITNGSMTSNVSQQQAILNFQNKYPFFASIKQLVTTGATLKNLAVTKNVTLNMYDVSSLSNGGNGKTVLNTHTTTTSTTTSSTTTTTTGA